MNTIAYIVDFIYTISFGLFILIYMNKVANLFFLILSVLFVISGFYIPLSWYTLLLVGSGLGGLFGLWYLYSEETI